MSILQKLLLLISLMFLFMACDNQQDDDGNDTDDDSEVPVGIHDYGNSDNYTIRGTVKDEAGNPVTGFTVTVAYEYGDGPFEYIPVITNSLGEYSFINLPSWSDATGECDIAIASASDVEVSNNVHPGNYERVLYWALKSNNYPSILGLDTMEVDMILREVVVNTSITGNIKASDGSIVPKDQIHLLDLITSEYSQGPVYGVSQHTNNEFFTYNDSTGDYSISNCLAGGGYLMNINTTTHGYSEVITVTPGTTLVHDIVLTANE